jgi:hypothetical protein
VAETKFRFRVAFEKFEFELEDNRDHPHADLGPVIQKGIADSVGRMLDSHRAAMALAGPVVEQPASPATNGNGHPTNGQTADPAADKPKKARRTGGPSLVSLFRELKKEGFFSEARSCKAIQDKLKLKAHNFSLSRIADVAGKLTQKNELHRDQWDEGFVYKDSPFDANSRPANAPGEPAA